MSVLRTAFRSASTLPNGSMGAYAMAQGLGGNPQQDFHSTAPVQPQNQGPILNNVRHIPLVEARAPIAQQAATVKKTAIKAPDNAQPSLYDRVTTTRNLQIAGIVAGSVAVAAALGALTAKVGTLAASQMIATSTVAFLQPGMTIFGFALKTGMFMTVNTVVPVTSGLITIALPVISTAVVTGAAVILTLYVVNAMMKKMEASFAARLTDMKDMVTGLPGRLMENIPGYSTISAIWNSGSSKAPHLTPEQTKAAKEKRMRNEIEMSNRASGSLAFFENLRDNEKNDIKRGKLESTVKLLKGERKYTFAEMPAPKGLVDLLDHYNEDGSPKPPVRRPGIYTRVDFNYNRELAERQKTMGENA